MIKALITLFHPQEAVMENVKRIAAQADRVYLCDNSPARSEAFAALASEKVEYLFFGENLGLSAAFNRVLKEESAWSEQDLVFFFDQDSTVEPCHLTKMTEEYLALEAMGVPVGCLGPVFFNESRGEVEEPRQKEPLSETAYGVSSLITSSMLCRYVDLKKIGFWNEAVFLDLADWDLSWRMIRSGKKCCMTRCVTLGHAIGNGEVKLGPLHVRRGAPVREYYQSRDCLRLISRSYVPMKFRIRFLLMVTVRPILHLLFLDQKKKRLSYILRGIGDSFRGIRGAYREKKEKL